MILKLFCTSNFTENFFFKFGSFIFHAFTSCWYNYALIKMDQTSKGFPGRLTKKELFCFMFVDLPSNFVEGPPHDNEALIWCFRCPLIPRLSSYDRVLADLLIRFINNLIHWKCCVFRIMDQLNFSILQKCSPFLPIFPYLLFYLPIYRNFSFLIRNHDIFLPSPLFCSYFGPILHNFWDNF